ncbi:MAG: endolytic transglycosylase MltG, partial [Clostridiales bacterium]|nr:endolytic transglycosylase MltG [Clostridiales bacterium]
MKHKKILNRVWNVLSFLMGTAYSWVVLAATVFLIYIYIQEGYKTGYVYAETSLISRPDRDVTFAVSERDTPEDVYKRLEKEGIIGNALLFRLENMLKGEDTNYKPGEYTLSSSMKTNAINAILRRDPENTDITIRIQEGYSLKDIATYLIANGFIPQPETDENGVPLEEDAFTWASHDHDFKYRILEGRTPGRRWLEGYLFPDTYFIRGDLDPPHTADSIINKMLTNFEDKYYNKFEQPTKENNLTINELITIASIIEKDF